MADLNFKITQNIILGSYTISRLPENLKFYGSRFIIVLDSVIKDAGLQEKILQPLVERQIDYFIFDSISDSANSKEIEEALNIAQTGHIHGVIAIGGSKALQIGEAIALLYNEKNSIYNFLDGEIPESKGIPFICVPITIHVPYVFTSYLPITDSRSRQLKLLRSNNEHVCRLVLWDTNLTLSLTENQKASISIESLCLATEAYISQKSTFFSDMFVEKSTELLSYGMDGAKSLEITTSQEELLAQGGALASIAASTSSIGAANLLAMTISSRYNISSAIITSILFPYIIEDAKKFKADKIEKLAKIFGIIEENTDREEAVDIFAENIRQRIAKANLPARLKELNISIDQLALAAEDAGTLDLMNYLPRSMTTDELFDLLKKAF